MLYHMTKLTRLSTANTCIILILLPDWRRLKIFFSPWVAVFYFPVMWLAEIWDAACSSLHLESTSKPCSESAAPCPRICPLPHALTRSLLLPDISSPGLAEAVRFHSRGRACSAAVLLPVWDQSLLPVQTVGRRGLHLLSSSLPWPPHGIGRIFFPDLTVLSSSIFSFFLAPYRKLKASTQCYSDLKQLNRCPWKNVWHKLLPSLKLN